MPEMNALKDKGIILIAAIMLIVFVSIAVLGVTVFIVQRLNQFSGDETRVRCIYNAQAGIQQAIYYFRFHDLSANGYFTLGGSAIDVNNSFTLAADAAELLMVNTLNSSLSPAVGLPGQIYRNLAGLSIQNATNSNTIAINQMRVTWDNSRRLQEIWINGAMLWSGNRRSPANCNLTPNFTLDTTPTIYPIDYLRFDGDMTGAVVSIEFRMTDGSNRAMTVYPASSNYNFTVHSAGQAAGSGISRTIRAEYNAFTSKITDYLEE